MHTGMVIEELLNLVERVEEHARHARTLSLETRQAELSLPYFPYDLLERHTELAGVA